MALTAAAVPRSAAARRGGVISSPINATLCGSAQLTCLMGRDGDLAARFGQPV